MIYYVYILESTSSNQFYIGQTLNLQARLEKHNSGYVKSTKGKGPWVVFFSIQVQSRSEAMLLEKKLKNKKSRKRVIEWVNSQSGK